MKALYACMIVVCSMLSCKGYAEEIETVLLNIPLTFQHKVEVFVQKPEKSQFPLLIFLHGASTDRGIKILSKDWLDVWVKKGYAVAAISMPGYGETTGRKDFCGPFTIKVLQFAIDAIKEQLGVSDFGIIGFGQGGIAALLLAAKRADIRCLVCANGAYDLLSHLDTDDRLRQTLVVNNYAIALNANDFKVRSPLEYVSDIKSEVILLHREETPYFPLKEAAGFVEAMKRAGKECILSTLPPSSSTDENRRGIISYEEILLETEEWIKARMQ